VGIAHQIDKNVQTPVVGNAHPGTIIARWNVPATIAIAIGIEIDSDPDSDLDFAHLTNKKMSKPQVSRSNKSPNGTLIQN